MPAWSRPRTTRQEEHSRTGGKILRTPCLYVQSTVRYCLFFIFWLVLFSDWCFWRRISDGSFVSDFPWRILCIWRMGPLCLIFILILYCFLIFRVGWAARPSCLLPPWVRLLSDLMTSCSFLSRIRVLTLPSLSLGRSHGLGCGLGHGLVSSSRSLCLCYCLCVCFVFVFCDFVLCLSFAILFVFVFVLC